MTLSEFIQGQFSEPDGTPSNNRILLFAIIMTTLLLICAVTLHPLLAGGALQLPNIPPSFGTFVEIVSGSLIGGSLGGKVATAYKDVKGASIDKSSEP